MLFNKYIACYGVTYDATYVPAKRQNPVALLGIQFSDLTLLGKCHSFVVIILEKLSPGILKLLISLAIFGC